MFDLTIGGQQVATTARFAVRNPATGAIVGEAPNASAADLDRAVRAARDAQPGWAARPDGERAAACGAVAAILTEMRLDDATIITALLHDTIEDTRSTWAEVAQLFGREVADLVDGVTKLTNLELSGAHSKQAENFRKLFMAMSRDLRVILVKLADRLHKDRKSVV